jgi:hypothetical protein
MRKHSSISLKRFRDIESVFKRGAFACVGRRERGAGQSKARCKHELALGLHTKGASSNKFRRSCRSRIVRAASGT